MSRLSSTSDLLRSKFANFGSWTPLKQPFVAGSFEQMLDLLDFGKGLADGSDDLLLSA